mgnify:CR=1 FL=1|tara:strand:- start:138 stop:947 length:810 start_codon:yes stop_codon:yes gene_type:complete
MPELPEVETVCEAIKQNIKSRDILKFNIFNSNLRWKIDKKINNNISNNHIDKIYRRGKYIIFNFIHGSLLIHLGMTGVIKLLKKNINNKASKHDHFDIVFKNGDVLRYNDVRKFGSVHWVEDLKKHFLTKDLGVEPLSKDFNFEYLYKISKQKNVSIKNLIMNQKILTGVGNIYASESLYLSKIHPNKKSYRLTKGNHRELVLSIKKVLKKAIKSGGTSLKDFKNIDGTPGYFKQKLLIYGKEYCKCGEKIKNIKINGRASFFCALCQR